jgi:hypothetical protein
MSTGEHTKYRTLHYMVLAHGRNNLHIQNFGKKISTEDKSQDLGVGLWIALNWILKKQFV